MDTNLLQLIAWIHDGQPQPDKEGILLIDISSYHISSAPHDDANIPESEESVITVQAKLIGNILAVWDCTIDQNQLRTDPANTFVFVVERTLVQLSEPSAQLPYAFTIRSQHEETDHRLSTFSEEDRESWVQALSQASRELALANIEAMKSTFTDNITMENPGVESPGPIGLPQLDDKLASALLSNWIRRRHEFKSSAGKRPPILCEEWMAESKLTILLPIQLLKIYRQWAQEFKTDLDTRLSYLPTAWNSVRLAHIRLVTENIERYTEALEFLDAYTGPYYRASLEKFRVAFAFAPINLHIQRFYIFTGDRSNTGGVDTKWQPFNFLTSGSFSAIPLRFSHGGAHRLHQKLHSTLKATETVDSVLEKRFCSRKATLIDTRNRLSCLAVEILRNWTGEVDKFREGKAGWFLLSQIKELSVVLKDWIETFPGICEAVAQLVDLTSKSDRPVKNRITKDSENVETAPVFLPTDLIENQIDNLEALMVSLSTKIAAFDTVETNNSPQSFTFEHWIESARDVANKTIAQMENLCETLFEGLIFRLVHALHNTPLAEAYYGLQMRCDVILSQTLSIVCSGILSKFWLNDGNVEIFTKNWHKVGPLFTILSHVSCYGEEKGILEDMVYGVRLVKELCRFRFVQAFSTLSSSCIPIVEGSRSDLIITLPIPDIAFQKLPHELQQGGTFRIFTVLWNVGINHEAFFGQKLGDNQLEKLVNCDALADFRTYIEMISEAKKDDDFNKEVGLRRALSELKELETQVKQRPSDKNVRILRLASDITQALDGFLLVTCKSGKDRTSMAVTLEQTHVLRENCGLSEHEIIEVVQKMRETSVRRDNCKKNIGRPTYAFSQFQMPFLPEEYRPPTGTYGQYQT